MAVFAYILVKSSGSMEVCEWALTLYPSVPVSACVSASGSLGRHCESCSFPAHSVVNDTCQVQPWHGSSTPRIRVTLTVTLQLLCWGALSSTWRVKSTFPPVVLGVAIPGRLQALSQWASNRKANHSFSLPGAYHKEETIPEGPP